MNILFTVKMVFIVVVVVVVDANRDFIAKRNEYNQHALRMP